MTRSTIPPELDEILDGSEPPAFVAGFEARIDGRLGAENPFDPVRESGAFALWRDGWEAAAAAEDEHATTWAEILSGVPADAQDGAP